MARPTYLKIDKQALLHNIQRVRDFAPKQKITAVIKANAYGHGLSSVADTLQHAADYFAVACIEEALQIRKAGIDLPVLLLEGFFNIDELPLIVQHNFEIVIHCEQQLIQLEQAKLNKPIPVWLKLDTGMRRLGFDLSQLPRLWQRLQVCENIVDKPKLMTHFPDADDKTKATTAEQIKLFQTGISYNTQLSLANSAGIIAWPAAHADIVRPGIMLYGVSPFAQQIGLDFGLRPVSSLHSQLIAIRCCKRGDSVGYGGNWVCPEDMLVGVVAIGYADGYPRAAKNGTPVLVDGTIVPLIGMVSMDMLTVDLRDCPQAKVGSFVTLWGNGLPVEQVAHHSSTIAYELLCKVSQRVRK